MQRVKVGTFNLFNLVKAGAAYYDRRPYSDDEFAKKAGWIARQLTAMDADVVGFQEIFHAQALEEALGRSPACKDMQIIALGETGEKPIVGLATRFPTIGQPRLFEAIPDHARLSFQGRAVPIDTFARPILRTELQFPEIGPVVVYVVHLKSKKPELPDGADEADPMVRALGKASALVRRSVEAMGLRSILLDDLTSHEAGPRSPVIVLGDFNDSATSVTSTIVSGTPPWRRLPGEQKKQVWQRLLHSAVEAQTRRSLHAAYYTHIHNGHHESLDHIFLSDAFSPRNPGRVGEIEYVRLFTDHLVDDTLSRDAIPRWQSDHGQVVATLRIHGRGEDRK